MHLALEASAIAEPLYVDGSWRAASGATIDVLDPATEERSPTSRARPPTRSNARSRRRAAPSASGRAPAPIERGAHLRAIADLIDAHRDELAALLVSEVGKPPAQADGEVDFAEGLLRYNAEWDRRLEGEILPGDVRRRGHPPAARAGRRRRRDLPVELPARGALPQARARRCSPATRSSPSRARSRRSSTLELRPADRRAPRPAAGRPQPRHRRPARPARRWSTRRSPRWSRSPATATPARRSWRRPPRNLTRVSLELGGKAPAIVWRDADLDIAVPAHRRRRATPTRARSAPAPSACSSTTTCSSRSPSATSPPSRRCVVGDPARRRRHGAAGQRRAAGRRPSAAVERARSARAPTVAQRRRAPGRRRLRARLLARADGAARRRRPAMRVMREETFGPVTPIVGVDSLEEALERRQRLPLRPVGLRLQPRLRRP